MARFLRDHNATPAVVVRTLNGDPCRRPLVLARTRALGRRLLLARARVQSVPFMARSRVQSVSLSLAIYSRQQTGGDNCAGILFAIMLRAQP
eukprot:3176012-Lingulodinium_polyedra.AAC.1